MEYRFVFQVGCAERKRREVGVGSGRGWLVLDQRGSLTGKKDGTAVSSEPIWNCISKLFMKKLNFFYFKIIYFLCFKSF
jgi:hypothetical protein